MKIIFTVIITVMMFISGCATATGPIFQETPFEEQHKGKAVVYFYRNSQVGGVSSYDLKINGKTNLPLLNKGYYQLILNPGTYDFEVFYYSAIRAENKFDFEGDKTYFIRYRADEACQDVDIMMGIAGAFFGSYTSGVEHIYYESISLEPKDEALKVLRTCRLIETASDKKTLLTIASPITAETTTQSGTNNTSFIDPVTGMEFVLVKGGCYQMGDSFGGGFQREKPVHEVCVDDFYVGEYLVTQGQWKNLLGSNPSRFIQCGDDCPVENISWDDTQEFIRIMNQRTNKKYRLLTEAEWEYAARSGGKNEKWSGTQTELQSELWYYVWHRYNAGCRTHPVGQKKPNGLGLYDMSGHVWEWVQDVYSGRAYSHHNRNNPIYNGKGDEHVTRGGSFLNVLSWDRTTTRSGLHHDEKRGDVGFRLVVSP